ncbi:chromate resistance protein ChrB domain-containing protein [Azohydromonas caseinilytica]|uniref:Chromate resistance protein n=1 Tax=Azohydromonas caseinilytica TaxID=2728836 RepID=A0A848FH60_9BURK|nr:chromate resistance protein ChrB domain-containing protein [Azohydromonas caseinilytica]NML17593.1 chromate resistance protein [Azohydromonas caseinilytica]
MWAMLILTLPTQPNAVRLRVWRTLKTLGCASLRDGAYLLPEEHAELLEPVAQEVREHGGSATVLSLKARGAAQKRELLALFDRGAAYAEWQRGAEALQAQLDRLAEGEARRRWRLLSESLQALQRIDYYPGAAGEQAQAQLAALRRALEARGPGGEPRTLAQEGEIPRLDPRRFLGRRWATRARPEVDRLACAWLIRRFIDPRAEFVWLADPALAPRNTLGFDFDGAPFTHRGGLVSFEVLAASFGLDSDPKLQRIGALVHLLDVGGIPVPEAAGVEAVLNGLRALHGDDDKLVAAAAVVFDALHAAPGEQA